jgi:hypothetical protein
MEIKNIHTHSSWYSSYEKSEQGKALIECQAKKIEQLASLLEDIKGEIDLAREPKEYSSEIVLDSIEALINQNKEVEHSVGHFKWVG